jgi:hypothetical protein
VENQRQVSHFPTARRSFSKTKKPGFSLCEGSLLGSELPHIPHNWYIHLRFLLFVFPRSSRGTQEASGTAPKAKICFFGGTAPMNAKPYRTEAGVPKAIRPAPSRRREVEAEDCSAAGRG